MTKNGRIISNFLNRLINFFGNIEIIKKRFNTKINKIIRISVMLLNFVEVHYLIMKFFIRGINFETWK